ncbi:MAG: radical SAM protein, partial [Candidatus Omnitrophica bacterium]|nr:radical SAM protein [Candidatus Omnitrophota bacterium]
VVPAQAATLLKQAGYEVVWLDCIAEGISYSHFLQIIKEERPDLIAMEAKTPVIKEEWQIINDLKKLRTTSYELRTVLFGDHVTALPNESFINSSVDFVLTGGDYDFLLLNLCNTLRKSLPLEGLENGIWYRENREVKNTGRFQLNHDLNSLPFIDRDLTKWRLYAYKNGNYRRRPGTYIMSGRDCWHRKDGGCTFCSWVTLYTNYRVRKPELVADEIGVLIDDYKVKTIFDDAGSFPVGEWLREFCRSLIDRGYNKKIRLGCNARFGSLNLDDYRLMKKSGFHMLLFGLESANQKTLNKINKRLTTEKIIDSCKDAKKAGLAPHITIMFGYPWETKEDAEKTFQLGKFLLKKGYADTLQATIMIPYPGTSLFNEAMKEGWLKTLDWERYDMSEPIMKTPMKSEEVIKMVQSTYKIAFNPEFIIRKIAGLRSIEDVKFIFRAAKKVLGHLKDFKSK